MTNNPVMNDNKPDDFLIETLKSQRDRIVVLKLERDITDFIKDDSRNRINFPGMSSYHRLIIHHLADYYKLSHYGETTLSNERIVVLYKTPFTVKSFVKLKDFIIHEDNGIKPSVGAAPQGSIFKILKRQTASDNTPNSEIPTRNGMNIQNENSIIEKKEEDYARARARIFNSNSETVLDTDDIEDSLVEIPFDEEIKDKELYNRTEYKQKAIPLFIPSYNYSVPIYPVNNYYLSTPLANYNGVSTSNVNTIPTTGYSISTYPNPSSYSSIDSNFKSNYSFADSTNIDSSMLPLSNPNTITGSLSLFGYPNQFQE